MQTDAGHPISLQVPWPAGDSHRIQGTPASQAGQGYNCDGHTDSNNFNGYAIDFDFDTPGTSVAAVAAGRIARLAGNDDDPRGFYVQIEHGDGSGHYSRYLHLQLGNPWPAGLWQGKLVNTGEIIGYSGNSGSMTTGPHLHFDLKQYPPGWGPDVLPTASIRPEPLSGWLDLGRFGLCTGFNSPDLYGAPDADGDGYSDAVEPLLNTDVFGRCGPGGTGASAHWPADVHTLIRRINIGDIGSFLFPDRSANDGHAGGLWLKFGHPLDDDGDTIIESNEDPLGEPGVQAHNVFRWNISLPPHEPTTLISIGDINNFNPAINNLPTRPPMFDGIDVWKGIACSPHPLFGD